MPPTAFRLKEEQGGKAGKPMRVVGKASPPRSIKANSNITI